MTRRASHQPLVTLLGVASACGDPGDIDNTQTVGNPIGQFSGQYSSDGQTPDNIYSVQM